MTDFERIRAAKKNAQGRLLAVPGVHAVGIGVKIIAGKRTNEPCITILLVKKKPVSEIPSNQIIPDEIDGIKTDVIEADVPRLHNGRDDSRERPLLGGTMIQVGGGIEYGTLGCFVHTLEPVPKIAALTCQHVVDIPLGQTTSLQAISSATDADPYTISFTGSNTPRSLVVVKMYDAGANQAFNVFYLTTDADTLATIASSVGAAIAGLGLAVNVTNPTAEQIKIDASAGNIQVKACSVYDPRAADKDVELRASISGTNITLMGRAAGNYGVYVSWNTNGPAPTHGAFSSVSKGAELASVASDISNAINAVAVSGIHATATGAQITLTGATQVECDIKKDLRVGQPTDRFCSACSACCNNKIGHVLASRLDLDVALVQLDSGLKYLAEVKEIGLVTGSHTVSDAEATGSTPYPVQKRGALTGGTHGTIQTINTGGYTTNDDGALPPNWIVFYRFYEDAIWVQGNEGNSFSERGDSGSAVLDNAGEVIGILFAGGSAKSVVTPIAAIESAFNVSVTTGTSLGVPQVVPDVPSASHASAEAGIVADGSPIAMGSLTWEDIRRMEVQIRATPAGEKYAQLVQQHFSEAQALVNTSRRVGAMWRLNRGPQLIENIWKATQSTEQRLPTEIDGKPLADCIQGIQSAFTRYGSPGFAADLRKYGPPLTQLAGLSYSQALDSLQDIEIQ